MTSLDDLRAFFEAFPAGAGEGWLAEHFGSTHELVAQACELLELERVEVREPGPERAVGIMWRKPRLAKPKRSNVIPFRRRAPEVDDGEI